MPTKLKKVGSAPHHELLTTDDADILVVVPEPGFKDDAAASRQTVACLRAYAQGIGRRCGLVVVANNLLAQEPESRRIYAEQVSPDLFYGITLVVSSRMARAIGILALRFTTVSVPFVLSEDIESGIAWIRTHRKAVE